MVEAGVNRFGDEREGVSVLLAGRFSFKSFDNGTTLVPEVALGQLAAQGIRFNVEGRGGETGPGPV